MQMVMVRNRGDGDGDGDGDHYDHCCNPQTMASTPACNGPCDDDVMITLPLFPPS